MGVDGLGKRGILLSGGIDSAALAFWKRPHYAIYINYGQRCADAEYHASMAIAAEIGMSFIHLNVNCASLGSGDLSQQPALLIAPVSEWWPYRNQLLLTLASMRAINLGIKELYFGAVRTDGKHIDGTLRFFRMLNKLIKMQEGFIRISVPAIKLSSEDLIRRSGVPASILGWTHSCHSGNIPCGICNGCSKHISVKCNVGLI